MTNPMLAELVRLLPAINRDTPSFRDRSDCLNFLRTHHATLADMAKRLETAGKGVTATDFATAMHNLGLSVATYARVDHEARRIARERAATQEGEG